MAKPYIHAKSSAKKYGGKPEDYVAIHEWFDQTKAFLPDQRHRALLHNSFGIFLCAQVFGNTIKNSDGKTVSVRDIGEQHVLEDFGGKFIPTPQDYLQEIEYKDWMQNGKDYPPSFQKVNKQRRKKKDEVKAEEPKQEFPTLNATFALTDGSLRQPFKLPETLTTFPAGDIVCDGAGANLRKERERTDRMYDGSLNKPGINPTVD